MKKLMIFSIGFVSFIISIGIFVSCTERSDNTTTEIKTQTEITQELAVNLDEKTNMYKFEYKKSVLNMSKEIFDEYNLTNENIQKFFDEMEKVYVLFADFFLVHNLPDVFTYNSVTKEYQESIGMVPYAWTIWEENATYYVEGSLERALKDIDAGLPAIAVHELGHLYTLGGDWNKGIYYSGLKYVWDWEVFAVIAGEYLASLPDFNLINASGGEYIPITVQQRAFMEEDWYDEWVKNYQCFIFFKIITISEAYGYNILHEVLAEMAKRDVNVYDVNSKETFDLFFDVYAEKTGENVKEIHFTQEELNTIYKTIESY